jgi:hypothetical protein
LLQLALIVADCPTAGDAGLAIGAQTGTPAPPPTHVTVCVGGVPDTTKLLQLGFVYVTEAAVAIADTASEASANNAEHSGMDGRGNTNKSRIFTVSPSEGKGRTQKPLSRCISPASRNNLSVTSTRACDFD